MARRFAEAGVRFIQITDNGWDSHANILSAHPKRCKAVDKPIAGLIKDLKSSRAVRRNAAGLVG